jgi:hypothetical protein
VVCIHHECPEGKVPRWNQYHVALPICCSLNQVPAGQKTIAFSPSVKGPARETRRMEAMVIFLRIIDPSN